MEQGRWGARTWTLGPGSQAARVQVASRWTRRAARKGLAVWAQTSTPAWGTLLSWPGRQGLEGKSSGRPVSGVGPVIAFGGPWSLAPGNTYDSRSVCHYFYQLFTFYMFSPLTPEPPSFLHPKTKQNKTPWPRKINISMPVTLTRMEPCWRWRVVTKGKETYEILRSSQ